MGLTQSFYGPWTDVYISTLSVNGVTHDIVILSIIYHLPPLFIRHAERQLCFLYYKSSFIKLVSLFCCGVKKQETREYNTSITGTILIDQAEWVERKLRYEYQNAEYEYEYESFKNRRRNDDNDNSNFNDGVIIVVVVVVIVADADDVNVSFCI